MLLPLDPTSFEALTTAGLLTLGGVVVVPRAVVCVGAGAVLGWSALGPAMLGTALGASIGFALARYVLRGVVERVAGRRPKVALVMRAVEAEGVRLLLLLRLASPIPGPLINAACGVTRMSFRAYLLATLGGVLPQTLLFVYLGLAGSEAVTAHTPFGLNTLTATLGIVLTLVALWRVKVVARRQTERALSAGSLPA